MLTLEPLKPSSHPGCMFHEPVVSKPDYPSRTCRGMRVSVTLNNHS